jgi:release factor glutamine methyltransferase
VNGWLFFEINENLGEELVSLLAAKGFGAIEIKKDINGKNRMLRCQKGDF